MNGGFGGHMLHVVVDFDIVGIVLCPKSIQIFWIDSFGIIKSTLSEFFLYIRIAKVSILFAIVKMLFPDKAGHVIGPKYNYKLHSRCLGLPYPNQNTTNDLREPGILIPRY
jgi:hypothetical protein